MPPESLRHRYDAGERRAVWDVLHAVESFDALPVERRDDVRSVVDATIARADANVREIAARLTSLGFVFEYPGDNAFGEPDAGLRETMALFAELGPLPPSIATFCARVGTVCLRGWLPSAGDEDAWKERLLDPLEILPDYDVCGSEVEPFIASGYRTKNGWFDERAVTKLLVPAPGVDAYVHEAGSAQPVWFVDYLRAYFAAGGFRAVPGTRDGSTDLVRFLANDLLEI